MISCVIVDDEELARSRLRALLESADSPVEIVAEASSARRALPLIHDARPDVIFVDVQMPVLDGFDLVDLIAPPRPHVVFVTAYDEYALQAFDVHAVDYLTKPVRLERLNDTLQRLAQRLPDESSLKGLLAKRAGTHLRFVSTRDRGTIRVLKVEDIAWFEAREKKVFACSDALTCEVHFTLDELERRLDPAAFARTHRSYIVNVRHLETLVPWFSGTFKAHLSGGVQLPVSRRRAKHLRALLGDLR